MKVKNQLLISVLCALSVVGCASPKPPPVVQKPVVKDMAVRGHDGRANVRMTVDKLVDYCDDWAKVYESRLGKQYEDGYNECVELTAQMMRDQAKVKVSKSKGMGEFPFVQP
jgi:uncharacterized lipoprotein YmbA